MATQNINIGINVSDNGTAKKTVKNFQEITAAATQAQRAAAGINTPGGTGGSRMVAARAAPGSSQGMSNEQYGNLRGTAGLTGASGRDFAQQAQGLGGVVRLYATYAANVFAVGAAFRALSGAMDTANLVKGLDQLGAASGTALGTLSKRLVEATDGAISLREAMESTAKASSSGMSSENILRMGKVAKQAAQALGVDMADAVNRLTRGITKLEPELLDELGIFTRVDMATQAYAKSVGKSASAITDFEKRMAFANSVLEEGERKFSAIDFETNPYTKLAASLKDVAQAGLEVINKVFAPIVKFLAQSPKALAIAIGAIGIALVKQALPALSQFKAGLTAASEEAEKLATRKKSDAVKAQQQLNTLLLQERDNFAEQELKKVEIAAEKLAAAGVKSSSTAAKLIQTNLAALDPQELKAVEDQIKVVNTQAAKYTKLAEKAAAAGRSPEAVAGLKSKAEAYSDAAYAAQSSLNAEANYLKTNEAAKRKNLIATLQGEVADKARVKSIKQNIVTTAAYNGSLIGLSGAIKLMNADLQDSGLKLGIFSKAMLFARAGVAAFAGMVTTVMSSIGGFLNIIATVGAAVAFASQFFSKNSKQMQEFGTAISATDDSLLNLGRTLDDIARKPFGEQFNTASLLATATAITEISTSVSGLVSKTLEADKAASGFDRFINGVKGLWGGDLRSQFGKSISSAVFDSFEKLSDSPQAQKAKASIAAILDVSPEASKKDFEAAFKAIATNEPKLRLVERAMKDLGMSFGQAADDAQQFDLATEKSKDAFKGFTDQFKIKDPMAEFAISIIEQSNKTAKALEEPESAIARLATVVQDTAQLQLFGEDDKKALMQYGEQIVNINKNFEAQKSAVKSSEQEVKKLAKALDNLRTIDNYGQESSDQEMAGNRAFEKAKKQLDDRREQLAQEQKLLETARSEVTAVTARFPQLAANQLAKGADILTTSIAAGFGKGSTAFADAVMGAVGDLPGLAKQRTDMELRKLKSEADLLQISARMLQATLANTAQLQRRSAQEAVSLAESNEMSNQDQGASDRLADARKELKEIDDKILILKMDPKQALSAIAEVKRQVLSGNKLIQKDAAELFSYLTSLAGNAQQQADNAVQQRAVIFKGFLDTLVEEFKQKQKALEIDKAQNNLQIQYLDLVKTRNEFLSETRLRELESVKITSENIAGAEKQLAIAQKLRALEFAKKQGGESAPSEEVYQKERGLLLDAQEAALKETQNKITAIGLGTAKDISTEQQRQFTKQQELNEIYRQGSLAQENALNKQQDIRNETAKSLGTFTLQYQAQQDAQLQATKIRLQAERDAQALTTQFNISMFRLEQEAKAKDSADFETRQDVRNRIAAEMAAYDQKKTAINSVRDTELDALKQVEEQRKKTDDFTELLDVIKNLDSVWTSFGSNLASTITIFEALTKSQKQYATTVADLEFERDAETDAKKKIQWQEKIDETTKASVKSEITGYGKVAGESKKLFKEKTGAYRTLAAVEKVTHLTRLSLEAKELAFKLKALLTGTAAKGVAEGKETAITLAGFASRLGTYIKEIYASWGRLGPWMVGAAALFIASKLGGSGGSGGGDFTPTAEQRQETQGTAMGYDSRGNKVQVRAGVFGDTDAKSESIANSLEIIKDNSVDGLSYDNRMLKTLESIDRAIGSAAKGLYGIQGLRTGSMFGTVSGSQSGGGLLGSGFLGSKTSRNITDSGLIVEGTFAQLASDTNAAVIDFFEQVTVSKKKWYGKTKTWVEEERKEIDERTSEFFQGIFSNATDLFIEVGKKVGIGESAINEILGSMDVGTQFASLRGLKGEDFEKELGAIIGTILDDASMAIFTSFKTFEQFGEGMLETVIRVVDGNEKVRQQIKNIIGQDIEATLSQTGVAVEETFKRGFLNLFTGTRSVQSFDPVEIKRVSYQITESLIELAGGLENFLDQTNFFRENFLTEAERLAPFQKSVTEEMARLGFASVTTRKGFKQLVQGLDLTTDAGRENFQALMNVAEGFDKVAKAAEDFNSKAKSMQMRILELTGTPEQLLAAQRAEILAETDDRLKSTQQYIFALEDVKAAEDALSKARQAEAGKIKDQQKATEGLVNNLKRYIESIRKFKDSLLLNAASPLTPAQKYAESKRQFDAILATATGTAATPEEQSAKDAALGQLEGSASAFLEASKVYNASSAQYMTDFGYVQQALTQTSDALSQQLSIEEESLVALNAQISALETVNQSVLSVADAVNNLAIAQATAAELKSVDLRQTAINTKRAVIDNGTIFGAQGGMSNQNTLSRDLNTWMSNAKASGTWADVNHFYDNLVNKWGFNSTEAEWLLGVPKSELLNFFGSYNLPAFAAGTNFVPDDMLAQVHRGERIIPAADNAQLMQNLNSRDEANRVLVAEIRNLRSEVKQLREQQAAETGSIIVANFDAQQRAAEQIGTAMTNTAQQSTWTAKVREGVKLK